MNTTNEGERQYARLTISNTLNTISLILTALAVILLAALVFR